ncbi:MAG: alanine racemase [Planctomycetes bacterium]|jgi:alanine racemase|nr:alanine racemase [Planctomycetota bacterium]
MFNFLRRILKPKYQTLNTIQINKQFLLNNYQLLEKLQPEAEIFPVLKANAYGHGLKELCQILNESSAKMVIVDSYPEAQIVYKYFKGKVLLLNEMPHKVYQYCKKKKTEFCIYNEETLRFLAKHKKGATVHLFVNTGMNREGIDNLKEFLDNNQEYLKKLEIKGLLSHLASAETDSLLNRKQLAVFFDCLDLLHSKKIFPQWVHLGNSAAIFTIKDKRFTAFRGGLSLYGYHSFNANHPQFTLAQQLQPALRIVSTITAKQKLKPGEAVSYNETYRTEKETTVVTIPFGYYEGLDRRLSNQAQFLVLANQAFYATIAGRVCMNQTVLDCNLNSVKVNDLVELVSWQKPAPNSIESLSKIMQTIPYEFLVKLQSNIRREIV